MARVKRAVASKKHRRTTLERAKGYYGNKSRSYRAANEQVMHSGPVRLPRPPGPQGRVPQALDPAHQRGLPPQRHQLQPVHQRPEGRPRSRSTARSSPTWPSPSRRRSPPWSRWPTPHANASEAAASPSRRLRSSRRAPRVRTGRGQEPTRPAAAAPLEAPQCACGAGSLPGRGADARRARPSTPGPPIELRAQGRGRRSARRRRSSSSPSQVAATGRPGWSSCRRASWPRSPTP